MDIFGSSPAGKVKKAARLLADARPLMDKDAISARRKLEDSLSLLQSVPQETPARTGTLTVTLLALARLERSASNHPRAVQLLEQALDLRTGLSDDDRNYLVVEYARAGRTDPRALDQYLAYISFRTLDPTAGPSGVVYDLLDRSCRLEENTPPEEVPDRLALCSRIIAADGRLGMPYFYRGRHSFVTGNLAAAAEDFKQAAERGVPQALLAYFHHLCAAYHFKNQGSLDHAANHFIEAVNQNPNCFAANFEAGQCLVELSSSGAKSTSTPENVTASRRSYAIALLERASGIDPGSAKAQFALGQAYSLDRNAEKAAAAFGQAAALEPCADKYYEHGRALRRAGSLQEAVTAAERALSLDPGHAKARWLAASASLQLRDFERAARGFQRLIDDLPPDHALHRNALHGLGVCRFEVGEYQAAIDSFKALQAQDLELTPEGNVTLARCYLRIGELDKAEALLAELSASDTGKGDALYYLGCCQGKQGRYQDAITSFTEAAGAGLPLDKCLVQRGLANEALGLLDAARRDYSVALEDADNPAIRFRLGLVCWRGGQHEDAIEHLRKANQTPEVLAAQATLSELLNDPSESMRLFRLALEAAPSDMGILRQYATSLLRTGNRALAREVLDSVESDEGGLAPCELGSMRLLAGDPEAAYAVWAAIKPSSEISSAMRIAALHAARKAHQEGDRDRSLEWWNQAAEQGTETTEQRKQRAIATAAAAVRSAASGAPAVDYVKTLEIAAQLDPENDTIFLLTAACSLGGNDAGTYIERLDRIAASGLPDHRPIAAYLLGIASLLAKEPAAALAHLRVALCEGNSAFKAAARVPYAYALAQSGRFSEAADLLGGSIDH